MGQLAVLYVLSQQRSFGARAYTDACPVLTILRDSTGTSSNQSELSVADFDFQPQVSTTSTSTSPTPAPAHLAAIDLEEAPAATWYGRLWQRHTRFIAPPDDIENDEISDCIPSLTASSRLNRTLEVISLGIILVSVATFCIETLPKYRLNQTTGEEFTNNHPIFYPIEAACVSWFTVEYLWRLFVAPDKWAFFIDGLNLVDLVAILPFYISFGLSSDNASQLTIVRILRLSRVSRLFKVSRHSSGLQDMITCIGSSQAELALFFLITIVATVLFASAMFYAEKDQVGTPFISIPASFWWAIVTMTTVGYGDLVPTTIVGRCIGAVCASLGVVLLAIPAGIFISEFMTLHEQKKREKALGSSSDLDATLEYHLQDALNVCQLMEVAHMENNKDVAKDGQPEPSDELDDVNSEADDTVIEPRDSATFMHSEQWEIPAEEDEADNNYSPTRDELRRQIPTKIAAVPITDLSSEIIAQSSNSSSRASTVHETEPVSTTPAATKPARMVTVEFPDITITALNAGGAANVDTYDDEREEAAPPAFVRSSTHEPQIEPVAGVAPSRLQPALNGRSYVSVTNL